MRKWLHGLRSSALVILAAVAVAGCTGSCDSNQKGMVLLTIGASSDARTILPSIQVASYNISFPSGPEPHDTVVTSDASISVELTVGIWDIAVEALNAFGSILATGSMEDVEVVVGQTTELSIQLQLSDAGEGAIDVTVSWPASITVDASEVLLDDAPAADGSVTIGSVSVRYAAEVSTGMHNLRIGLYADNMALVSVIESVQVYSNLTSSGIVELTTRDFTDVPAAPSGFTATEGLASIALQWTDESSVETGYLIERSPVDNSNFSVLVSGLAAGTKSYSDSQVDTGTTYYYRVRATNAHGQSDASGEASAMVQPPVSGASGAITVGVVTTSTAALSWTAATDNATAQGSLQYRVVGSTQDNIRTVSEAQLEGDGRFTVQTWSTSLAAVVVSALSPTTTYYFNVLVRDAPGNVSCYVAATCTTTGVQPQIIADHTVVDQYANIPEEWIAEVKKMWLDVPGESHSKGYRNGVALLEEADSRFQVNVLESGTPEGYTDQYLRVSRATRNSYSSWTYSYGEEDWYTNTTAITMTKAHLEYCNTHDLVIAAMGFGWCWDMTWGSDPAGLGGDYDPVYQVRWSGTSVGGPEGSRRWGLDADDYALTGNTVCMDTYLNATQEYIDYCSANGYGTWVFFTTGPVDGYSGEDGYQRHLKQEYIRAYVKAHSSRILFDYADILAWSNSQEENLQTWTDNGGTPQTYQLIHSDNKLNLDGSSTDSDGDHIGERGALRLAKAMWWMLARIAGWSG